MSIPLRQEYIFIIIDQYFMLMEPNNREKDLSIFFLQTFMDQKPSPLSSTLMFLVRDPNKACVMFRVGIRLQVISLPVCSREVLVASVNLGHEFSLKSSINKLCSLQSLHCDIYSTYKNSLKTFLSKLISIIASFLLRVYILIHILQ